MCVCVCVCVLPGSKYAIDIKIPGPAKRYSLRHEKRVAITPVCVCVRACVCVCVK